MNNAEKHRMDQRRVLLAHDHPFPSAEGLVLDDGRFGDLDVYCALAGELIVIGRTRSATTAELASLPMLERRGVTFSAFNATSVGELLAIPMRLRRSVRECGAVVSRMPSRLGALAAYFGRLQGIPVMVEVVGCAWDAYWNHGFAGRLVAPIAFVMTRWSVRRAEYVQYVTQEFLQRRYPTSGKSVACSDVVLSEPSPAILETRVRKIRARTSSNPLVLCTVGAVNVSYKGHEYVLRAMRILKESGIATRYRIIGGGDRARLEGLVSELGLVDDVKFLGSMSRTDVLNQLTEVDVYIQPSRLEGLPRALVEAMSVGLPALGSRVGGIPELLERPNLFEPGDAEGIARRLAELNAPELEQMACENSARIEGFYHPRVLDQRRKAFLTEFRCFVARETEASK